MLLKILDNTLLSHNWYILRKYVFKFQKRNGEIETHKREVYDRGNGAAILLYNTQKKSVILTKQFRLPTYLNQNKNGMMIEVCAGILDEENPEKCVIRETKEETGYDIKSAKKIFEAYMSPGAITEIIHFYIAEYNDQMKTGKGGGLDEEHEDIEVIEVDFEKAYKMIANGDIKDAKTIMLLQYAKTEELF
jgi:nudix-type nucleoside diphosphatase (YffH/AdpP family)